MYGNEFNYYRNDRKNSFVENGVLNIKATLTVKEHSDNGRFLDQGSIDLGEECTHWDASGCVKQGSWDNILKPVQSAMIKSNGKLSLTYGRIEFQAQLPKGDWLRPVIELHPATQTYGSAWPQNGAMKAFMFGGNAGYDCGWTDYGRKCVRTQMFYGIDWNSNEDPQEFKCTGTDLSDGFHDYKLEWSRTRMKTFVDGELIFEQVFPSEGLCDGASWCNNGNNLWSDGSRSAPFDEEFYLGIGMLVGGTGFFPDSCDNESGLNKPWTGSDVRKFWWGGRNSYNDDRESFDTWSDPVFRVKEIVAYSNENSVTTTNSAPTTTTTTSTTTATSAITTTTSPSDPNFCWMGSFKYNVIYISFDIDWANGIDTDIKRCVDYGYNMILLAFLQGSSGSEPVDAFVAWNELSKARQTATLDYAHARGAKILLSIGGAEDHIDGAFGNENSMDMSGIIFHGMPKNARDYAQIACRAVIDNRFDGVDYDLELHPGNSGAFSQGYMNTFLEEVHIKTREMLPQSAGYIVSHAPMAPYASV
jgi:beta-glucanase (GH16 family)